MRASRVRRRAAGLLRPRMALAALLLVPARAAAEVDPAASRWQTHCGVTFEAGIGLGFLREAATFVTRDFETSLAGLNLGVGGFAAPQLAIGIRLAGVVDRDPAGERIVAVLGPAAQLWLSPNVWLGGGVGLGVGLDYLPDLGLGLDARLGVAIHTAGRHSFNLSVELTPVLGGQATYTGLGILAGYQHL